MSDEATAGAPAGSTVSETASVNTEVAQEGQNASEGKAAPLESKPVEKSRNFKVKVDGADEDVSEDELLASYSKVKAANKRFEEAAEERKRAAAEISKAEKLKESMKSDPWSVLSELGINSRKAAEDYLIQQLELDAMSPEQKETEALKKRLKEYEERESRSKLDSEERAKKELQAKEMEEIQRFTESATKEYEAEFQEALESSKLPRNPKIIARIAEIMLDAEQEGYTISAKQASKIVVKEMKSLKSALMDGLDPEMLAEFLGEENIKKLRKRDVEKLRNPVPESRTQQKEEKPKSSNPVSPDEWLRAIKKQHGLKN